MAADGEPSDVDDPDAAFYRAGLAGGRVLLQRCDACSRVRFPPLPTCPYCASRLASVIESKGAGHVYSWVTVRRALTEQFAGSVPYAIAVVQLDEGCRVIGRMREVDGVACETRVQVIVAPGNGDPYLEFARSGS